MKVRKSDLGRLTFLAEGGFGKVYRVEDYLLPGNPAPLAYKDFATKQAEQAGSAVAAVKFREGLSPADRSELDLYTTWPLALVEESGSVCGFLMQLIPKHFFFSLADPDGSSSFKPRALEWLIMTASKRSAVQADIPELDQHELLMILALLTYVIGRLHKHGWVFGDISFKNAVFAVDPPRVMVLDCDGAAALANTARKQYSTPFFDPPECPIDPPPGKQVIPQDQISDVYKLGLVVLRCLTPGKGAGSDRNPNRLAGELDARGTALIARALSEDRAQRPTTKELYAHLYQAIRAQVRVPEVVSARLTRNFAVRGHDVRIEWHIENAAEVTIVSGNHSRLTVDLAGNPRGYAFLPDASGPVSLEVQNRFAVVTVALDELTLYDLPPFSVDLDYLPRPGVPAIDAFSLAPVAAILADRPRAESGLDRMPPVPSPSAFNLIERIQPSAPETVPLPSITETVVDVANGIKSLIEQEGISYTAALRQGRLA